MAFQFKQPFLPWISCARKGDRSKTSALIATRNYEEEKGSDSRRRGRETHVKRRNWSKAPAETRSPDDRSTAPVHVSRSYTRHRKRGTIVPHLDVATRLRGFAV